MKLHIENFARISSADILLDGLTVIAGNNNTGKSTIGKVLYAFFRGQSDIVRRVKNERIKAVRDAFRNYVSSDLPEKVCTEILNGVRNAHEVLSELLATDNVASDLGSSSSNDLLTMVVSPETKEAIARKVEELVLKAKTMPFEQVSWNIFRRVLECVFHGQYHPLKKESHPACIQVEIKGDLNEIRFYHDRAELKRPTRLFAKARLVSTPDVIGLLNVRDLEQNEKYANVLGKETYELAVELIRERIRESVISEAGKKEIVDSIVSELSKACGGLDIERDGRGDYVLLEPDNDMPTKVENLSMGMKFFVLIKRMLVRNVLTDQDVLIFDEPENHLHPEWQVVYAHAVVLLQKAFHLTVLVTSHSEFFINALQRFAISEDIADKTHFYVSRNDDVRPGYFTFDDKGIFAGQIFRSFNRAYDRISEMSGEAEDEDFVE